MSPQLDERGRRIGVVLWSSFLAAGAGSMFFFALIDPADAAASAGILFDAVAGRTALYTIGFAFFWAMCALAAGLSAWLLERPRDPR